AETDQQELQVLDSEGGLLPEVAQAEAPEFAEQNQAVHDAETDRQELETLDSEGGLLPEIAQAEAPEFAEQAALIQSAPDAESVERVSRYNFDELSRILNDRVGETAPQNNPDNTLATRSSVGAPTGALINLGGETLVLNRLPLGILVFRDQQVLFANRAITEMVGYDSVERLRNAGLAAIFPAMGPDGHEAGPVNHLVQRDGSLVPVTARLQSISWQGRPALMLSASATEVRTGHEGAVRAFAEAFADVRSDGFFETNRAGVISANNGRASELLGGGPGALIGRTLTNMIDSADQPEFKAFLERPARFAESARPCLTVAGNKPGVELLIFAQGQAGVLSGYFGFVHRREGTRLPAQLSGAVEPEPALLARISRGVRRPLNTIIGFSDLIRSEAFGALQNDRYEAYAQDIKTAGHEIAALVDELDDYARLKDGRYLPQRASIELVGLLESCVQRVRQQAGSARVIVRSAISEKLPRITADRASLAQAVLNLLASAIDQTPTGGAVVISAQTEDDGAIAVHVRDSATTSVDMAERFVVFRDGVGRDGEALAPVRSSVGLALTRSLLAVNAFSLTVDPAGEQGMLFSLLIPADLVDYPPQY
ncbi:PAS domain-containing sensor histidine kinase, partial [Devosia sp.]|uniref:sensor histidine kinase n=1 Tax=Devosia sp. TaxID=1871048 RepID=UPI0032677CDB